MGLVVGLILFSACDRRGRRPLGCGSLLSGFFSPFGSLCPLFYRRRSSSFVSVLVVIARKSERGVCASTEDSSSTLIPKELLVQLELDSNDSKVKRSQKGASLG